MLNKADLVANIAEKTGETKAATERFVNAFQDLIIETVSKGEDVRLSGFASFTPATRAARTVKNPQTGESMEVPEKKTVRIKPLKKFVDSVRVKD